nr:MAG TPA: hypothetical protein [Caudoviricetes sp.]
MQRLLKAYVVINLKLIHIQFGLLLGTIRGSVASN